MIRRGLWAGAASVVVLAAGMLAACGSSTSVTSSASDSKTSASAGSTVAQGQNSSALAAEKAAVAKYEQPQSPITVPPLPHKPATGKTLVMISCSTPACVTLQSAEQAATKTLGWKFVVFNSQVTPQGYQAAWQAAVQAHPSALSVIGITPDATVAKYIAQIQQQGIPWNESPPAGDRPSTTGPLKATYDGYPQLFLSGELMGDLVSSSANGPTEVAYVEDPTFAGLAGVGAGVKQQIDAVGGTVIDLPVSVANIGKTIPGQVVSFLQSHPNVKYVLFQISDLDVGVVPALKSAGLAVKIISRIPQGSNLAAVKSGGEFAEIGEENICDGYRALDGILREMEGVPLGAFATDPPGWHQIFIAKNVTETTSSPPTPGCPAAFLKAWHLA